jgi:hypothetical protein
MNHPTRSDYTAAASLCHLAATREHRQARAAEVRISQLLSSPLASWRDVWHQIKAARWHEQRELEYRTEAARMARLAKRTTETMP